MHQTQTPCSSGVELRQTADPVLPPGWHASRYGFSDWTVFPKGGGVKFCVVNDFGDLEEPSSFARGASAYHWLSGGNQEESARLYQEAAKAQQQVDYGAWRRAVFDARCVSAEIVDLEDFTELGLSPQVAIHIDGDRNRIPGVPIYLIDHPGCDAPLALSRAQLAALLAAAQHLLVQTPEQLAA